MRRGKPGLRPEPVDRLRRPPSLPRKETRGLSFTEALIDDEPHSGGAGDVRAQHEANGGASAGRPDCGHGPCPHRWRGPPLSPPPPPLRGATAARTLRRTAATQTPPPPHRAPPLCFG